jgi:23S rRNA (cytosine1962-C5)-methyltransferase
VVIDPTTFINSKRIDEFLDIQRYHVNLISYCLNVLKPGGELFFSNNLKSFRLDEPGIQATQIKNITRATTPFDFEGKLQRSCFLITK